MLMAALADTVSAPRRQAWAARLAMWCAWVAVTTVGWLLGSLGVLVVQLWTTGAADALIRSVAGSALLGGIVGLAVGVAQWLVLRREQDGAQSWIAVNAGAWAVAWAIGQAITGSMLDDYWLLGLVPGGLLLAVIVGVCQWLSLKRCAQRAGWWLPASLIAWSVTGVVCIYGGAGLLAMGLAAFVGPAAWLIAAVPGAFAGLVTGTALMRLRLRPTRLHLAGPAAS
jgi:hypothetical protein